MAEVLESKLGLPDFSLRTHCLYQTVNQTLISLKIPPLEKDLTLDLTTEQRDNSQWDSMK